MTTNVAPDMRGTRTVGFHRGDGPPRGTAPNEASDDALREGLRDRFRPELLGRIGAVVAFRPLDAAAATAIADKTIDAVLARLEPHARLAALPADLRARIREQAATLRFGARDIERIVEQEIGRLVEGAPPAGDPPRRRADGQPGRLRMKSATSAKRASRKVRSSPSTASSSSAVFMARSQASRMATSTATRAWRMRRRGWPWAAT